MADIPSSRGCCIVAKVQRKWAKVASFVFQVLSVLVSLVWLCACGQWAVDGGQRSVSSSNWRHCHSMSNFHWTKILLIVVTSFQIMIFVLELKEFFRPNLKEKFMLMIQGTHRRRKQILKQMPMYSGTIKTQYERNSEGIIIFFSKMTPRIFQSHRWFTFIQSIATIAMFYVFLFTEFPILLLIPQLCQVALTILTYYSAQDLVCCGYTRDYKHTNNYTRKIQRNIEQKFGEQIRREADELDLAVKQFTTETVVGDDTMVDVGPVTAKRFEDLAARLHLFLVREHEKEVRKIYQLCNLEDNGVSLVLTAEEIAMLEKYAEDTEDTEQDENIPDQNNPTQTISIDRNVGEYAWLSNIETRGTIM